MLGAGKKSGLIDIAPLDEPLEAMSLEMANLTRALHAGVERKRSDLRTRPPCTIKDDLPFVPTGALPARCRRVASS